MMPGIVASAPPVASGVVYTTLNPEDCSSNVVLSGGNLVASGLTNSSGIVRSVHPITGKRYFEAVISAVRNAPNELWAAGIATSAHALSGSLGFNNPEGWAFWSRVAGARHNGAYAELQNSEPDDVLGFAVDQPNGLAWIRYNGVYMGEGDPEAGTGWLWDDLAGSLFAAACPWDNTTSIVTMRFDPASFRDPAPAGFEPITAS